LDFAPETIPPDTGDQYTEPAPAGATVCRGRDGCWVRDSSPRPRNYCRSPGV